MIHNSKIQKKIIKIKNIRRELIMLNKMKNNGKLNSMNSNKNIKLNQHQKNLIIKKKLWIQTRNMNKKNQN